MPYPATSSPTSRRVSQIAYFACFPKSTICSFPHRTGHLRLCQLLHPSSNQLRKVSGTNGEAKRVFFWPVLHTWVVVNVYNVSSSPSTHRVFPFYLECSSSFLSVLCNGGSSFPLLLHENFNVNCPFRFPLFTRFLSIGETKNMKLLWEMFVSTTVRYLL